MSSHQWREAGKPSEKYCGAKTQDNKDTCALPPGYKTSHPGIGQCYKHGGNSFGNVKCAILESDDFLYNVSVVIMYTAKRLKLTEVQFASIPKVLRDVMAELKIEAEVEALKLRQNVYIEERKWPA
jgi:hypothetical protein